jgi:hypothetical protein
VAEIGTNLAVGSGVGGRFELFKVDRLHKKFNYQKLRSRLSTPKLTALPTEVREIYY